jgi:hypothetical protein
VVLLTAEFCETVRDEQMVGVVRAHRRRAVELQIAGVRAQVGFSLVTDFENFSVFNPAPHHVKSVNVMLD